MDKNVNSTVLPVLSIVVPCYNSGEYLPDALKSIREYPDRSVYEVIIVNDGSTDAPTLSLLAQLQQEGYTVIHQDNKGPAGARNTGVKASRGKYLFFVDSDNKIRTSYIDKGIETLNTNPNADIVYGNPAFFGDTDGIKTRTSRHLDVSEMLIGNYIDVCAIMRREVWEGVGGFDENRILIGHEDWDFWLMAISAKFRFHYIDDVLFDYRVRKDSLTNQVSQVRRILSMQTHIYTKHLKLLVIYYKALYNQDQFFQADQQSPFPRFF